MNVSLCHTSDGSFAPAAHIEFVRNKRRNAAFQKAFERHASGKIVLDVGTGSGLLAIYAARAGAKKVIAIEKDIGMIRIALDNLRRNGLADRIELQALDALSLPFIPPVDIILGEMLSTWCVVEPQVPVIRHILALQKGKPVTIPRGITNYVQAVYASFGDAEGLVSIPTVYFEFESTEKAKPLSDSIKVFQTLFAIDTPDQVNVSFTLRALHAGTINALRLTSLTETANGIWFGTTDDTMPTMIVPLRASVDVTAGQKVECSIVYRYGAGWENFSAVVR